VLTVTGLTDGEYLLSSVALGIDEYYAGVGEAPGVWSGGWSPELGVSGMVEADDLRALIDGNHPTSCAPLLAGLRERSVKAFDLTFSAPKSVSLLWALGSEAVADTVMTAHRDAVAAALGFLEEHAATARLQTDGIRRHVPTHGWVVAEFVHRTSREGDPQLHTHCLVPNLVQREVDGRCVALAARPLFVWARAAGSIYQAELQRSLSVRLGAEWGPDRSNTRDLLGFTPAQLRAFSKRTVAIEAELEAVGAVYESPALRMQADDQASLATRPAKDRRLTPGLLVGRWQAEAATVDLEVGRELDRSVCWREPPQRALSLDEIVRALLDEDTGLCAHFPRFAEPDVIEHVAALSAGRLTIDEIRATASEFLVSEHVVRLVPARTTSGWEPARWSTAAHRALEDATLDLLDRLVARPGAPIDPAAIVAALGSADRLGADQRHAVSVVCGPGGGVRAVLAPAGHGKTAMVHTAARAAVSEGRAVIAVATTTKAVAELADSGLAAFTIARLRLDLTHRPLAPGTVVVLDEISQTSTRDLHTVLTALAGCAGGQLWVLGDPRQAPSVKAGGVAVEIEQRIAAGAIPAAPLTVNRRQLDPVDRHALTLLRDGQPGASQQLRTANGWEHEASTPGRTRAAMADAVTADIIGHGPRSTVALVVSHGQAEDFADGIRDRLAAARLLDGPALRGPGWTSERAYQAGDRILLHTRHGDRHSPLVNGTVATITVVDDHGLVVHTDGRDVALLPVAFVQGTRADGSPNVSHAWARTVDGAQGGTWDHAHLLGCAGLDAHRGYTGQSRSRHPTHTWNTTTLDTGDHGGRLADRRTGPEQVAAALTRLLDTTMAADDDPWRLDRHLRAVIAAHQAVLDRQPPDPSRQLADARTVLAAACDTLTAAEGVVAAATVELERLGPFAGVTPAGRTARHQLETDLDTGHAAIIDAAGSVASAQHRVDRLGGDQTAHDTFERVEGWRRDTIANSRDRLDAHWTDVALACAADQPLAYGPDPLRLAHRRLTSQLAAVDATVPTDRQPERDAARRDVSAAITARRTAAGERVAARAEHAELAGRRWPRRDSAAIGRAADRIDRAETTLEHAHDTETVSRAHLHDLDDHQDRRRRALQATAPERRALTADIELVADALDRTRPDRVLDLARQPSPWQVELLGPVPDRPAGHAVWCDAAHQLEVHLDFGGRDGPTWKRLCRNLADTPESCAVAHHHVRLDRPAIHPHEWAQAADASEHVRAQLRRHRGELERPTLEHGVGLELGL
jgi:conjugative relaxase-like TrwC/TraI family protein